jgi:enoyl-CoA hydratase/carnithine racemase
MCSSVMQAIVNCLKLSIAEVTGVATAAGCQLVASCDLAVAVETAKFSTLGVHNWLVLLNAYGRPPAQCRA